MWMVLLLIQNLQWTLELRSVLITNSSQKSTVVYAVSTTTHACVTARYVSLGRKRLLLYSLLLYVLDITLYPRMIVEWSITKNGSSSRSITNLIQFSTSYHSSSSVIHTNKARPFYFINHLSSIIYPINTIIFILIQLYIYIHIHIYGRWSLILCSQA